MARLGLIAPRQSAIGMLEGIKFARDEQERSLDLLRKQQQIVNASLANDQLQQSIDFTNKANPLKLTNASQGIALNNQKIKSGALDLTYKPITIEQEILASQQKLRAGEVSIAQGNTAIAATNATIESTNAATEKTKLDTLITQGYGADQAQSIIESRNAQTKESQARADKAGFVDPIDQLVQQYNAETDPVRRKSILDQIAKLKAALTPQRVSASANKPSVIGRPNAAPFRFGYEAR